ncbi:hypothetical protein AAG906_031674 [Vitis piasezkii]
MLKSCLGSHMCQEGVLEKAIKSGVNFLTWKAAWGKILTLNQINRRGWFLASHCCMCKSTKELVDHLLIHCGEAKEL